MTSPGRLLSFCYLSADPRHVRHAACGLSASGHACPHPGRCLGRLGYSLDLEVPSAAVMARCSRMTRSQVAGQRNMIRAQFVAVTPPGHSCCRELAGFPVVL
jgi:hypothetical protein